jgi:hypothetical protein
MLGGATITARTRDHALEMLAAARAQGGPATPASAGKGTPRRARSGRAGSANDR